MNKKRWIVVAVLACMMLFVSSGMAYVRYTIVQYNGACSVLTGLPGLLQTVGFVSAGTCIAKGPKCDKVNAACTYKDSPSGPSLSGTCKQQNNACVCTAK